MAVFQDAQSSSCRDGEREREREREREICTEIINTLVICCIIYACAYLCLAVWGGTKSNNKGVVGKN